MNFDYIKQIRPALYDIPVVKMMVDMYTIHKGMEEDSDDFLLEELKLDPVLRFVHYVLYNNSLAQYSDPPYEYPEYLIDWQDDEGNSVSFSSLPKEKQEGILRYITAVFYSVKGTAAVFTKLTSLLKFDYVIDQENGIYGVTYTPDKLDFYLRPECVGWISEEEKFINYFTDFLSELLFLGPGTILNDITAFGFEAVTMNINDTVRIKTNSNIDLFRHTIVDNEN